MNITAQITYHGIADTPTFRRFGGPHLRHNSMAVGMGESAAAAYADAVRMCQMIRDIDVPSLDKVLPKRPVCLPVDGADEKGVHVVSIQLKYKGYTLGI